MLYNRPETEFGRRSFVHRSTIAWNALTDNLKDSSNSSIFMKYNSKQSKRTIMNINFGKGGNVTFTITSEIHARSLVNFYCQYADRHINLKLM